MTHTDTASTVPPAPPSLRDAAKALAAYLRQNSAMMTMALLNLTIAVEQAVEREKDQLDLIANLRKNLRARAEKAEAELATLRRYFIGIYSMPPESSSAEIVEKAQEVIERNADFLALAGHAKPMKVAQVLPLVVDELLRLRAEKSETVYARVMNDLHQTLERAGVPGIKTRVFGEVSLAERIEWLVDDWKRRGGALEAASEDRRDLRNANAAVESVLDDVRKILGLQDGSGSVTEAAKTAVQALADMKAEHDAARKDFTAFAKNVMDDDIKAALGAKEPPPKREPEPCLRPPCTNGDGLLVLAWGLLCNVSGGDWHQQTPTWHGAMIAWREDWHRYLDLRAKPDGAPAPTRTLDEAYRTVMDGLVNSAVQKVLAKRRDREAAEGLGAKVDIVRDPVTGALGVGRMPARDPVTGWTFDKFRRELDAARTTAKGNAGLFAQAMQELAAAKGGA